MYKFPIDKKKGDGSRYRRSKRGIEDNGGAGIFLMLDMGRPKFQDPTEDMEITSARRPEGVTEGEMTFPKVPMEGRVRQKEIGLGGILR